MTEPRCPDCEWVGIRMMSEPEPQYVVTRYCDTHRPPPTPLQAAHRARQWLLWPDQYKDDRRL